MGLNSSALGLGLDTSGDRTYLVGMHHHCSNHAFYTLACKVALVHRTYCN